MIEVGELAEFSVYVLAVVLPSSFFVVLVVLEMENSVRFCSISYINCAPVPVAPADL